MFGRVFRFAQFYLCSEEDTEGCIQYSVLFPVHFVVLSAVQCSVDHRIVRHAQILAHDYG